MDNIAALVDTGAEACCIDSAIAARLQLATVDRVQMIGVHGGQLVDTFLAQLHVPMLRLTIQGAFAGVPLENAGLPFQAVLGRTFLQYVTMTYDGRTGSVIMSRPG